MSEIQQLLAEGDLPGGSRVQQISDALLCAAAHDDDFNGQQRLGMVKLLLPNLWAIEGRKTLLSEYFDLINLDSAARVHARELASLEVRNDPPTQAAPAATYEGNHRNGT